jgi:hypothetical protein
MNRDPVSLGYSNIITKIPITRSYNGVEKYQQPGFSFAIRDRSVRNIIISVLDDDMQCKVPQGLPKTSPLITLT